MPTSDTPILSHSPASVNASTPAHSANTSAAQAIAHEECVLHAIKISDLHDALNADRDLALALLWNFVRTLSDRLRATNDKVMATFAMASFG